MLNLKALQFLIASSASSFTLSKGPPHVYCQIPNKKKLRFSHSPSRELKKGIFLWTRRRMGAIIGTHNPRLVSEDRLGRILPAKTWKSLRFSSTVVMLNKSSIRNKKGTFFSLRAHSHPQKKQNNIQNFVRWQLESQHSFLFNRVKIYRI